jgi:hypothetical protein
VSPVNQTEMSYERQMLEKLAMPTRSQVEKTLLRVLLKHGGVVKEFGAGEEIVDEVADLLKLTQQQRSAYLERTYRKENRLIKAPLWHRLLFRAADSLAMGNMVSRPTQTRQLTGKREWMLTERGFDEALRICGIPELNKDFLPTKSFEVQKIAKLLVETPRPEHYDPVDAGKKLTKTTRESAIRTRGFRQAVVEAYEFRCAVCGLKINSPDSLTWEVEAAHIVPNRFRGRDDIWNGIALCRLHHWAFDVGWFTLHDDYRILLSSRASSLPPDFGKIGHYDFVRGLSGKNVSLGLPTREEIRPHVNAIQWHRENLFFVKERW